MRDNAAPGLHPPVNITLEPHHDLGLVEHPRRFHPLQRLTEVELRVVLWHGMDVVQGRIAVDDLYWLTNLRAEDVRCVLAALLSELNGCRRRRELAISQAVLDVDEDVLQPVTRSDDNHF